MDAGDTWTKIASYSKITQADVDGLKVLDPATLATVMQSYVDDEAVADHGVWVRIGQDLQAMAPYLAIAGAILGIAEPIVAMLK